jgi:hypothetical protein
LIFIPIKIKIVGRNEKAVRAGFRRRLAGVNQSRPYNMRVSRDHGGGLWTIESEHGQLYLAVLSPLSSDLRREREISRGMKVVPSQDAT